MGVKQQQQVTLASFATSRQDGQHCKRDLRTVRLRQNEANLKLGFSLRGGKLLGRRRRRVVVVPNC